MPEYPALPPYLSVRDQPGAPHWPAPAAPGYGALLRRLASQARRLAPRARRYRTTVGPPGRAAAVLGYLTVPLGVVPVLIYLSTLRGPCWARAHTAQAVNVWFTGILYDLSAVIMGMMLALDSPQVALMVFAPLVAARWAVTLGYLGRAARAARRGAEYTVPSWLCMRAAR